MGTTKNKLKKNLPVYGGWVMTGNPVVAELLAGEGFDWIAVDLEHTATTIRELRDIALALKGSGVDLFARLPGCDEIWAKHVLDGGASGIIVPLVNNPEDAARAVSIAKFPPEGNRGAAFSRAADYGRNFQNYFKGHNDDVTVVVMLEHIQAADHADDILSTPGVDAVMIGPYDLSASMGLAGQLDHPDVQDAQRRILEACQRQGVAPGLHVVQTDPKKVADSVAAGYRFIACGLDTEFIIDGARLIRSQIPKEES